MFDFRSLVLNGPLDSVNLLAVAINHTSTKADHELAKLLRRVDVLEFCLDIERSEVLPGDLCAIPVEFSLEAEVVSPNN